MKTVSPMETIRRIIHKMKCGNCIFGLNCSGNIVCDNYYSCVNDFEDRQNFNNLPLAQEDDSYRNEFYDEWYSYITEYDDGDTFYF